MGPSECKSDNPEREERILDAAAKLIIHYGYDKTTVSDIAREAGVSKGALYLHWKRKDDLFEALLWREIWRYMDEWLGLVEADPNGGMLWELYKHSLIALRNNPFIMALMRHDKRVIGNYVLRGDMLALRDSFKMREDLLRAMRDAGVIRQDIDMDCLAYIMSTLRYGFLMVDEIIPHEDAPPFDEVMEALIKMLTSALAPPDGGSPEAGKRIVGEIVEMFKAQQAHWQRRKDD